MNIFIKILIKIKIYKINKNTFKILNMIKLNKNTYVKRIFMFSCKTRSYLKNTKMKTALRNYYPFRYLNKVKINLYKFKYYI